VAAPPDETRPPAGAARLFHTIVVGASLGCGGGEVRPQPVADASTPASFGGDDANVAMGARDVTTVRADGAPTNVCDCARPGTFRCRACASGKSPIRGRCIDNDGVGCECDPSVLIAAPGDCPHPEQFVCNASPDSASRILGTGFSSDDWYAFADCSCDPTLPLLPSDCDCERCDFTCTDYDTCSASTAGVDAGRVRYACTCLPPLPPIR
jgi:hypothetical protein